MQPFRECCATHCKMLFHNARDRQLSAIEQNRGGHDIEMKIVHFHSFRRIGQLQAYLTKRCHSCDFQILETLPGQQRRFPLIVFFTLSVCISARSCRSAGEAW